ncbi:MAG: DUF4389 domain-containing protein [Thermomicrobiales bacterium]
MDAQPELHYDVTYPERLSRLLIFVKWLLIIPHAIILYFLILAVGIVHTIAWFAILITGSYPRGLFDFMTGVSRWANRVLVYVMLLTDAYPPFTLGPTSAPAEPYGPDPEIAPARF